MRIWPAAILLSASLVAFAAGAPVDAGKSKLVATFTQMNVPVDGQFKSFTGHVTYDPKNVGASSAELEVDTSSFDLGDDDYNAEIRKKEWFDVAHFKTATFKSTAIRALGSDRFEAEGTLALKGQSQKVKATVSVKTEGGARRFEGSLPLSRTAFAIGDPQWNDVLADQVTVKFVIVAPAS